MSEIKPKGNRSRPGDSRGKFKNTRVARKIDLSLYLPRTILVLACFVLFLPLAVNSQYYYPYIFYKSILFRICVQLMALLYAALALASPSHRPRLNRITYALLAYFAVLLFCSLPGISVSAWNSWWGDFRRMDGMFTQLHLLAYFFVLAQTLKEERDWLTLFAASLFSGILLGFTGLIQYMGLDFILHFNNQDPRVRGATGNANFFATYMLLALFIAFYFLSRTDKSKTYPIIAKTWLVLLIAMDLFLLVWDLATGGQILSAGLTLFPIVLFAFFLHSATLFWWWMRRNVYVGTIILSVLSLYYLFWMYQSQTRAVVVGLAGSLAFVSILYVCAGASRRVKYAAALGVLLVILLPPTIWINRQSPLVRSRPILARFASISSEEHRLMAWKAAVSGIRDHPLWGWGLENYNKAFDRHASAQLFGGENPENWYDRAHNEILDIGTMAGCVGLAAYLIFYAFVLAFLLSLWFKTRDAAKSLSIAGIVVAYLLQSLFTFNTVNTGGVVFLLLAYIAYLYNRERSVLPETSAIRPEQALISLKNGLILVTTVGILACACRYVVKRPRDANLQLNYGLALEKAEKAQPDAQRYVFREALMNSFKQANDYGTTGRYQVREEFANYACELALASDVPREEKVRAGKMAAALLERSILEDPSDARHYMYFASLVNRIFGDLKQADPGLALALAERNLSLLQKAEILGPNRPQVFLERAQSLVLLGRIGDAIPDLQKAIAFAPTQKPPHVDLVTVYISVGRYKDAEREWQTIKDLSLPVTASDYDQIIGLFAAKGQFEPVVGLYKEQLQKSPDNPILLAHLAATYRDLGDMDSARQTARKAAALSPQIAAQLEDFLKSLSR